LNDVETQKLSGNARRSIRNMAWGPQTVEATKKGLFYKTKECGGDRVGHRREWKEATTNATKCGSALQILCRSFTHERKKGNFIGTKAGEKKCREGTCGRERGRSKGGKGVAGDKNAVETKTFKKGGRVKAKGKRIWGDIAEKQRRARGECKKRGGMARANHLRQSSREPCGIKYKLTREGKGERRRSNSIPGVCAHREKKGFRGRESMATSQGGHLKKCSQKNDHAITVGSAGGKRVIKIAVKKRNNSLVTKKAASKN